MNCFATIGNSNIDGVSIEFDIGCWSEKFVFYVTWIECFDSENRNKYFVGVNIPGNLALQRWQRLAVVPKSVPQAEMIQNDSMKKAKKRWKTRAEIIFAYIVYMSAANKVRN